MVNPISFSSYQVPGVYVQGTMATVVTTSPSALNPIVTLIGLSQGYALATDTIAIQTTATALSNKGVMPLGVAVNLVVTNAAGVVMTVGTDYTVAYGPTSSDVTTISLVPSSPNLTAGALVSVSYSYADSSYYSPKLFSDLGSITALYGPALTNTQPTSPTTNQVVSPLTMAATVAFANGATQVLCVPLEPPSMLPGSNPTWVDSFNAALSMVSSNPNANLIVPILSMLPTTPALTTSAYTALVSQIISNAIKPSVISASNNGYGRIAFIAPDNVFDDTITTPQAMANSINSSRICLAYPWEMNWYNANLAQTTEVGGCYLAAAYAALMSASAPNRSLTRLSVGGFVGIPAEITQTMNLANNNALSAAGVAVTEVGRTGQLVIRHGLSTNTTPGDLVSKEISMTRGFDLLYRLISDGVNNANLIGMPITSETTAQVSAVIASVLETAITDQIIVDYHSLAVVQEALPSGNPSVVEATFFYEPFVPLNYILVNFAMDLTTGQPVSPNTVDTTQTQTTTGH